MSLLQQLKTRKSKSFALKLAMEAANDKEVFKQLARLACSGKAESLRASWALGFACEMNPEGFRKIESDVLQALAMTQVHPGIIRNLLRIFLVLPPSNEHEGRVFNEAFRIFFDHSYPVAARAYALSICTNMLVKYPELSNELRIMADFINPDHGPALNVVARRLKQKLAKIDNLRKV